MSYGTRTRATSFTSYTTQTPATLKNQYEARVSNTRVACVCNSPKYHARPGQSAYDRNLQVEEAQKNKTSSYSVPSLRFFSKQNEKFLDKGNQNSEEEREDDRVATSTTIERQLTLSNSCGHNKEMKCLNRTRLERKTALAEKPSPFMTIVINKSRSPQGGSCARQQKLSPTHRVS